MLCSLQAFWRTSLLLCLPLLLLHHGEARILTEVQSGPLYRVVGYPLSISCHASGFSNPDAQQHFEFRTSKPQRPTYEINVISTSDPDFSFAMYSMRVRSKEITLEHVSPASVLFSIQKLTEGDDGEYDCAVINSEVRYDGVYSAKTTVKVIDNSLTVSYPDLASLSHDEGDTLTLTCHASSNTVQHTHLSVTWYLRGDGEDPARPIISLDRDLTLSPGQGFERRYQAGLIGLEKVGEATYKLKMVQLEQSDQGRIYCQAQEWIQDPDRSWYSIAQNETEAITLTVKAKEMASDKDSLVVRISVQQASLQEGQALSVDCNVDTQNQAGRFYSLAWLRDGVELARIGPAGILSVGSEYSGRESGGEMRVTRTGARDQRLTLTPVRTQDQGQYICRAWPQDIALSGVFTEGAEQDSTTQSVTILATESGLSVDMMKMNVTVNEGDKLQLTCKASGFKGQLSVTWQHRSMSTGSFSDAISLTREGVTELGAGFRQRNIQAMRPTADTFALELSEVTPSDAGVYQCTVSEWTTETNGNIKNTRSQSQISNVAVPLAESLLTVYLISRTAQVTVGGSTEMMCRIRGPRLPATVTWSLQRQDASLDTILTLAPGGDITWHGDQGRYQLKTTTGHNVVIHTLHVIAASHREAGRYQCEVSVFLQKTHRKRTSSNRLEVMVNDPVSKLSLVTGPYHLEKKINADVEMKCSVNTITSPDSRFAVTWLVQREAEINQTILSSDRDAVLTFGPQVDSSARQRISMKRGEGRSLELTIRQARIGDSGTYMCVVVEWLQDPLGQWYELPPVSKTLKLQIIEPANDLHVDKTEQWLTVREEDEVELNCTMTSGASGPSFLYIITWFYTGPDPSIAKAPLVRFDHDGLLTYPENQRLRGLQGRLRLSRPTHSSFRLGIRRAEEGDGGAYQCRVEQHQLNQEGSWQQKGSDDSGTISLTVKTTESNLSLLKEDRKLNVSESQEFTISCDITTQSSQSSAFQVTWFWQKETEGIRGMEPHPIFTAYRNSTLQYRSGRGKRLRFVHPVPNRFNLTVTMATPADNGLYFCEVEEWLLSPSQGWRQMAVNRSGESIINVQAEANDLHVDKTEQRLTVREEDEVKLNCTMTSGASGPSFLYTITWLYTGPDPSVAKAPLVRLDHNGLLTYPENQRLRGLQGRLRLSRPTHSSFRLGIRRAEEGDGGAYQCRVEQYQLNQEGSWQQKDSDDSGTISLTVKTTESNLSLLKEDKKLNVSESQEFTISCDITTQSSQSSAFQVTWFWQNETEGIRAGMEPHPIFTTYRNSTLQDRSGRGKRLRFVHPVPNRFNLTVTMATPADSGLYFCEVEEWLLSPSHGWRQMAVNRSGESTINVQAEGRVEEVGTECSTGLVLGVLLAIIICLLGILVLLGLKIRQGSGAKKPSNSLWAEEHPLKLKPIPED